MTNAAELTAEAEAVYDELGLTPFQITNHRAALLVALEDSIAEMERLFKDKRIANSPALGRISAQIGINRAALAKALEG